MKETQIPELPEDPMSAWDVVIHALFIFEAWDFCCDEPLDTVYLSDAMEKSGYFTTPSNIELTLNEWMQSGLLTVAQVLENPLIPHCPPQDKMVCVPKKDSIPLIAICRSALAVESINGIITFDSAVKEAQSRYSLFIPDDIILCLAGEYTSFSFSHRQWAELAILIFRNNLS